MLTTAEQSSPPAHAQTLLRHGQRLKTAESPASGLGEMYLLGSIVRPKVLFLGADSG